MFIVIKYKLLTRNILSMYTKNDCINTVRKKENSKWKRCESFIITSP